MSAPFAPEEYVCTTWFERDRRMVSLATPNGREIFALWDEAVDDAIESGYLPTPKHPRPSDKDWQPCASAYAREMGLLQPRRRGSKEEAPSLPDRLFGSARVPTGIRS
jgi:hypothetical protein